MNDEEAPLSNSQPISQSQAEVDVDAVSSSQPVSSASSKGTVTPIVSGIVRSPLDLFWQDSSIISGKFKISVEKNKILMDAVHR